MGYEPSTHRSLRNTVSRPTESLGVAPSQRPRDRRTQTQGGTSRSDRRHSGGRHKAGASRVCRLVEARRDDYEVEPRVVHAFPVMRPARFELATSASAGHLGRYDARRLAATNASSHAGLRAFRSSQAAWLRGSVSGRLGQDRATACSPQIPSASSRISARLNRSSQYRRSASSGAGRSGRRQRRQRGSRAVRRYSKAQHRSSDCAPVDRTRCARSDVSKGL